MTRHSALIRVAGSCMLLVSTSAALAAGGGGGGAMPSDSMPSISTPAYDPAVEYQKGLTALQAQNYREASRAFDRVLRVAPHDANSNLLAGLARSGLGDIKSARRFFEKALKYNDTLITAHQELALAWVKLGNADKARTVLDDLGKRAIACADKCPQAAELGRAIRAIESALSTQASTEIPPPSEPLISIGQGDHAYLRAVALINEKRYHEAIGTLDTSSRAFGPHPDILTYLGFAYRKLGRLEEAERYYRQALAIAPDHLGATEYYGELMVQRGDVAGGRRMLAKLKETCAFGCAQVEDLRRWIAGANSSR